VLGWIVPTITVDVTDNKIQDVGVRLSDIQLSGVALLEAGEAGCAKVFGPRGEDDCVALRLQVSLALEAEDSRVDSGIFEKV